MARLRAKYAGRLRIGLGIEVCYQPAQIREVLDYLDSVKFDFVLLSVHWWDGTAVHMREHWSGLDWRRATKGYLEQVLSAMQFCLEAKERGERPFDVLGHLDLVKRYTQRFFGAHDIQAHGDLIDEIWRTALAAEVYPEINTSSWRTDLREPMPGRVGDRAVRGVGGTDDESGQ